MKRSVAAVDGSLRLKERGVRVIHARPLKGRVLGYAMRANRRFASGNKLAE